MAGIVGAIDGRGFGNRCSLAFAGTPGGKGYRFAAALSAINGKDGKSHEPVPEKPALDVIRDGGRFSD